MMRRSRIGRLSGYSCQKTAGPPGSLGELMTQSGHNVPQNSGLPHSTYWRFQHPSTPLCRDVFWRCISTAEILYQQSPRSHTPGHDMKDWSYVPDMIGWRGNAGQLHLAEIAGIAGFAIAKNAGMVRCSGGSTVLR
jgi:hypothetical protein